MRLKIYLEIDVMKNRGFDFGDFEITKREILASYIHNRNDASYWFCDFWENFKLYSGSERKVQ